MAKLYRITPLEKKSIEAFYDVYKILPDGTVKGWSVTETYRWGQGFRELDDAVSEWEADEKTMTGVCCNPQIGWGAELDDLCATWFEFDDSFTDEEKEEIENLWYNGDEEHEWGGAAWLFDGAHDWQVEDDNIRILPPFKIDIVDEDAYNETIEENVSPTPLNPSTDWPFLTKEPE
jgi:hypothetical protein